jgi:hypothetical protein
VIASTKRRLGTLSAPELRAARLEPYGPRVLQEDWIVCLECGRRLVVFGNHATAAHGMTADQYREKWGYNRIQTLAGKTWSAERSRSSRKNPWPGVVYTRAGQPPPEPRPQSAGVRARVGRAVQRQQRQKASYVALEQVLALHQDGRTPREIADAVGSSLSLVYARLKKAGLTPHAVPPGTKSGVARPDISDRDLVRLREQGLSVAEVAEVAAALNCTVGLAKWRLRKVGATSVKCASSIGRTSRWKLSPPPTSRACG